jgi:hypothetical protein
MDATVRQNVLLQGATYRIDAAVTSMGEDAGGVSGTTIFVDFPTPRVNDCPWSGEILV